MEDKITLGIEGIASVTYTRLELMQPSFSKKQ